MDDFERTNAPAPWAFYNGAEFPGATGSLTAGPGYSGRGAHLAYDLSQGGAYVSANLTLPTPLTLAAISFWLKSPTNITIILRVVDASGQTLQYNLCRPLENLDPVAWYQQAVPLDSANLWWGGAKDGQLHSPISSLAILAGDPLQSGPAGAIDFGPRNHVFYSFTRINEPSVTSRRLAQGSPRNASDPGHPGKPPAPGIRAA